MCLFLPYHLGSLEDYWLGDGVRVQYAVCLDVRAAGNATDHTYVLSFCTVSSSHNFFLGRGGGGGKAIYCICVAHVAKEPRAMSGSCTDRLFPQLLACRLEAQQACLQPATAAKISCSATNIHHSF